MKTQAKLTVNKMLAPIIFMMIELCFVYSTQAQVDFKSLKQAIAKDSAKNKLPRYVGGEMQFRNDLYRYVAPGPSYSAKLCARFNLSAEGNISEVHFFREGMFLGIDSVAFEKAMLRLGPWRAAVYKNKPTAITNFTIILEDPSEIIVPPYQMGTGPALLEDPEVFAVVEQQPEAPGGISALRSRARIEINRPKCFTNDTTVKFCKVHIRFIVDNVGNCIAAEILKGCKDCPELNAKALGVIQAEKNWEPGRQQNKKVNVYFNLPVVFVFKD